MNNFLKPLTGILPNFYRELSLILFAGTKVCFKFAPSKYQIQVWLMLALAHGVIGNTPVFGTVIQGSSPCGPTSFKAPI